MRAKIQIFTLLFILQFCLGKIQRINVCPAGNGPCIYPNGETQNNGMIMLSDKVERRTKETEKTCLELCRGYEDATGCEMHWGNDTSGCFVHTHVVAMSRDIDNFPLKSNSGDVKKLCWILSKCMDTDIVPMMHASQSTTEYDWMCNYNPNPCGAHSAIDGSPSNLGHWAVTLQRPHSWWQAELTETVAIEEIIVYINGWAWKQSYYDHTKFETRLSAYGSWETCKGPYQIPYHTPHVRCDRPTTARYLKISLDTYSDSALYLWEVFVVPAMRNSTTRAPYTTTESYTTDRRFTTDSHGLEFHHVRRLHSMESEFEKLGQNLGKILQILQNIPEVKGVEEILKDVRQIPQIAKILKGPVVRFPNPIYGDNNTVEYFVQGHVEVLHDNKWGSVCSKNSWEWYGENNANVLCRKAGYKRGEYHNGRYRQRYATKSPTIWPFYVRCYTGKEANIQECEIEEWYYPHECSHRDDVGVRCYI